MFGNKNGNNMLLQNCFETLYMENNLSRNGLPILRENFTNENNNLLENSIPNKFDNTRW